MYAVKPTSAPKVTRYTYPAHDAGVTAERLNRRGSPAMTLTMRKAAPPASICMPVANCADEGRAA